MRPDYARRALLTAVLISGLAGSAFAQSRDEIREQNEQLYQQYQQGSDQSGTAPPMSGDASSASGPAPQGAPQGGDLLSRLLDRVQRLEEQNRQLSGRVDELERDLQTETAQLNKQIGDLSFAVQQGGHPGAAMPGAETAPAAPMAAAPPPPPRPHEPPARPERAASPATPPPGPRGAGMAYQLARNYTAQGNYRQAALTYYDVYNRAPHGPLAADALLHVSASMASLGQNGAACEALGKLHAEFPRPSAGIAHQAQAVRARAHC